MNKLFCKLTGGHRFKSATLETRLSKVEGIVYFSNICDKCGKKMVWIVQEADIYPEKYREMLKL